MVQLGVVTGALSSWDQLIHKNALRQARQMWEEDIATGAPVRDDLAYPDPVTGQPNRLDAGRRAVTVSNANGNLYRAGTWVLRWSGTGTVQVDWANGVGVQTDSSVRRMTATIASPADPFQVRILATDPADPVRLVALTHIDDETSPDGFQPWWVAAWRHAGNKVLRPLNWMEATTLRTMADVRPDTWWTESDESLDSWRVILTGDLTSTLGQRRDIYRGGSFIGHGWIVRGIPGGWHFRLASGSLQVGDQMRVVGAGSGPVISEEPGPAQTAKVGCSIGLLVRAAFTLDIDLHLTLSIHADDAYYRHIARRLRDELPAGRRFYVEFGNETWNPSLLDGIDYRYCNDQGVALNMPGAAPWEKGAQWACYRATVVHAIFREEFTGLHAARLFNGIGVQHAAGEYWYRLRTIINPDDDPVYRAAWPRIVPSINFIWTAPYFRTWKIEGVDRVIWSEADWQAHDDAQLETNLRQDTDYEMRAVEGTAPFRGGGIGLYQTLAAERATLQGSPCTVACYEAGQEVYPPSDASTATRNRILAFQNSSGMRRLFDEYWQKLDASAVTGPVCVFSTDGVWGPFAAFGLYRNPLDGLADDVKYQSWLQHAGQNNLQLAPAWISEHWDRSRLSVLVLRPSMPQQLVSTRYQQTHGTRAGVLVPVQAQRLGSQRYAHQHGSRVGVLQLVPGIDPVILVSVRSRHVSASRLSDVQVRSPATQLVSQRSSSYTCSRDSVLTPFGGIREVESLRYRHWHSSRVPVGRVVIPQGELTGPVRLNWRWRPRVSQSYDVMPDVKIWSGAAVGLHLGREAHVARPFQRGDRFIGFAEQTITPSPDAMARVSVSQIGFVALRVAGLTGNALSTRFVRVLSDSRFEVADVDAAPADDICGRVLLWHYGQVGLVYVASRTLWDGDEIIPPFGIEAPSP